MKPASVVTIEMYLYDESKYSNLFMTDKLEHVVSMNGKEIYRVKTSPKKWHNSNDPLRVFEKWLIDEESKVNNPSSEGEPKCFGVEKELKECLKRILKPIVLEILDDREKEKSINLKEWMEDLYDRILQDYKSPIEQS